MGGRHLSAAWNWRNVASSEAPASEQSEICALFCVLDVGVGQNHGIIGKWDVDPEGMRDNSYCLKACNIAEE